MERGARIFVAGSEHFLGAAVARRLAAAGYDATGTGADAPDLRDADAVDAFFARERPQAVLLLGGRSGGIALNQREPAALMLDNLLVESAVIPAAHRHGVRKLVYVAAACIYPRDCEQPMRPEQLGTGPVEPTSEPYAMAKWAGLVLCRAFAVQHGAPFVTVIPSNPFGPGDDTRTEDTHVVGALLRRTHEAKQRGDAVVTVWGSGRARRDFLFVDDLADALLFVLERYDDAARPLNVSSGAEVSIAELAERVQKVVGYAGRLVFDPSRPDGAPRKALDGSRLAQLGWTAKTPLDEALAITYRSLLAGEAQSARG